MDSRVSRRAFLRGAALTTGALVLSACQPAATTTAPPEKVEEEVPQETAIAKEEVTAAPQAGECQMDWTPTEPPAPVKYDPPIQISTYFPDNAQFIGNDDWLDNPMYNRVKEGLSIEYTIHAQASGELLTQKRNADIAAGTLPDMFGLSGAVSIQEMIENDVIEDIRPIWDATASDLTKQKKEYPDNRMWYCVQRDDKLYGVAWTNGPGFNVNALAFIRQDWLDEVGLDLPETIDEITETMAAWREAGIGTYGMVACKNLFYANSVMTPVFGAYGVMPRAWRQGPDGQLVYNAVLPQAQEALAQIHAWYADGYIDPDFYTLAGNDARVSLGAGKNGIYFAPWYNGSAYFAKAEAENPPMKMVMMPLPKGPRGEFGTNDSGDHGRAVVFKKGIDPTKIEAAIHELNWHTERHVNWEEYQQYGEIRNSFAFVRGYGWEFDDNCELKAGDVENIYPYTNTVGFGFPHMCYPMYQADIFSDMLKWGEADPASLNKAQRFLLDPRRGYEREAEYYLAGANPDVELADEFIGVPGPNMLKFQADLNKLVDETYLAIISGAKPVEAFDEFVNTWKASGGDAVTDEVNAWWASKA